MRTPLRKTWVTIAALAAAAALAACQQQNPTATETNAGPTDAEREASMAADMRAQLGGPADAATRALYEGDFEALGSLDAAGSGEGTWELRLLNNYAQFERPNLGQDGGIPGEREFHQHGMQVIAGPLTIVLMAQQCALPNGNVDYSATVLFEGVAYQGCARRGVSESSTSTWASVLPELIPAIDSCLTRVGSRPGRVTVATSQDEGQVSVRIREADGTRHECIAPAAGGAATIYDSLSDVDILPSEGHPEFQRGEARPAARNCRTVEEAKDAGGGHLGWFINRSC